jgi:hypothetical protein
MQRPRCLDLSQILTAPAVRTQSGAPQRHNDFGFDHMLYASSALWHFRWAWWAELIGITAGIGCYVWAVSQLPNGPKKGQDRLGP